jgi:hypothetical protein
MRVALTDFACGGLPMRCLVAFTLMALSFVPLNAAGQSIRGRVLETGSTRIIPAARIQLLDFSNAIIAETTADDSARFALDVPRAGEYRLRVERLGYATAVLGPIRLGSAGETEVTLRLGVEAVPLDALTVDAEAVMPWLNRAGFYDRRTLGLGHFFERDDIAKRTTRKLSDLFRGISGVRVVTLGQVSDLELRAGGVSNFGKIANARCRPPIFLDGLLISHSNVEMRERYDLDSILPTDIEGIEVYASASQVPPQYGGAHSMCGVVLLWTRK